MKSTIYIAKRDGPPCTKSFKMEFYVKVAIFNMLGQPCHQKVKTLYNSLCMIFNMLSPSSIINFPFYFLSS